MKHIIYPVKNKEKRLFENFDTSIIKNPILRYAFQTVKRKDYLPDAMQYRADLDVPLPIGHGQTSSAPGTIYKMLKNLHWNGNERILEIGTGCGYQTEILCNLGKYVYSIEIIEELFTQAKQKLLFEKKISNLSLFLGDGSKGLSEKKPFDIIIVSAALPLIPNELTSQLNFGGQLITPVGFEREQDLFLVTKDYTGNIKVENLCNVTFVPINGTVTSYVD